MFKVTDDQTTVADPPRGVNPAGYTRVPNSLFADERFRRLSPFRQMVLIALLAHRNSRSGEAWPRQVTLATMIGSNKHRGVRGAIKAMRAAGLIETKRGYRDGATRLLCDDDVETAYRIVSGDAVDGEVLGLTA